MVNCINLIIEMSPRFILGRENVPCVAEVVNRSLKADCTDFNTIFTHFKNSGDDIFFLQDLRADSKNKLDKWLQKWEGPSYSAGKDKSSSIAILFRKNTQFEVNKISEDENGRFLLVNGTKDDKNVTLCNIYAPSGPQKFKERKLFFENLKDSISEFQPDNSKLILGGDFNCATDVDLDRSRIVSKTDSSVNKLKVSMKRNLVFQFFQ